MTVWHQCLLFLFLLRLSLNLRLPAELQIQLATDASPPSWADCRYCNALLHSAGETLVSEGTFKVSSSGDGSQVACFSGSFQSVAGPSFLSSWYFPVSNHSVPPPEIHMVPYLGFPSPPFCWRRSLSLATGGAWGYDCWGRKSSLTRLRQLK